ncbi:MAG: holo-ACP synthase [candidate division WOR-3 bacterium]|nr:holo-ACP synthase [candidate division WOR-3 bacterium]
MVFGIGIDIIEVARIRKAYKKFGKRFLEGIYTEREQSFCLGRANFAEGLAARWAAKEAFLKALGTGHSRGVRWRDVEIIDNEHSRPTVKVSGKPAALLGNRKVHLSISHLADMATAIAIIEE